MIHPVGIESSNPISRSLKCCPTERERQRVRENNRITLHWAQQELYDRKVTKKVQEMVD